MRPEQVTVIGSGIGGLTFGNALQEKGIDVEFFEQAPEFKPVGSGITVQPNALQILDRLSLLDDFRQVGAVHKQWLAVDKSGEKIFNYEHGFPGSGGAHRATLHKILRNNIDDIDITFSKKCVGIDQNNDLVTIEFADGTDYTTSNPVVAADGTFSAVREALFPDSKLEPTGQLCHRGLPKDEPPDRFHKGIFDMWCGDFSFGLTPFGRDEGLGYLFFSRFAEETPSAARPDDLLMELDSNTGEPYDQGVVKQHMLDLVDGCTGYATKLVESIPEETIVTVETLDSPRMDTWSDGKIVLLGDSAHSMTPFLAQGGAMAMEDGLVLANCLAEHSSYQEAYNEYESLRIDRAYNFVDKSREVGTKQIDRDQNAIKEFHNLSRAHLEERFSTSLPDQRHYKL